MSEPRDADTPSLLALLGGVVAVWALQHLPLPGVDRETLAAVMGPEAARVPLFLGPLALVGLGVSPRASDTGSRALLVLTVLVCGGLAWGDLAWLVAPPYYLDALIERPGLGAAALPALSSLAAHALLLILAARLDGPRVHGLWWVVGVAYGMVWWSAMQDAPALAAQGDPLGALVLLAGLLPSLGAAVVWVALQPRSGWVRSALDAGCLSLTVGAIFELALRYTPMHAAPDALTWGARALGLAVPAAGTAAWAVKERTGFHPLPALATALVGGLLWAGTAGFGAASNPDAIAFLAAPGPFDGEIDAVVILGSDDPGPGDVDVLRARLERLGVAARLEGSGGRARVELRQVVSVQEVMDAVLPRRAVRLHGVVEEGHDEPVERVVEDCSGSGCQPMSLGVARIDARHIESASVRIDDAGYPMVWLAFTDAGAQAFGDWTESMVRKRIAIVVDDQVMSVPMVTERIGGGRAVINLGREDGRDPLRDANALASALNTAPLQGSWAVVAQ